MSVEEMDTVQASSCEDDSKQVIESIECQPISFRNNSHSVRALEILQSLRKNEVYCDIRFETDDGCITFGHKHFLMAASPYFHAMFGHFSERNKDHVNIRKFDSTIFQLLMDYMYTGEITVTKENVEVLLPAANILQLDYVSNACAEFLQKQLNASNCIAIKALADLHNCTELLSISEGYIKQHFLKVVKSKDFLSLSFKDLVKFISCNELAVPFEEKVYDCVITWVNHDSYRRKRYFPALMRHVRLPLITPEILYNVFKKNFVQKNSKVNYYLFEALNFNIKKNSQPLIISKSIRCKPRQFGPKVILMFYECEKSPQCYTEWYDPVTKLQENAPGINNCHQMAGVGVIADHFVLAVGGLNLSCSKSVSILDASLRSPSWVPMVDMLVSRSRLGVGVLDNCIYAVGGTGDNGTLNSVEVFDVSTQKWRMVASMCYERSDLGVGVLNNRLYAVGGDVKQNHKSVECYDPTLDTWTPVAEMAVGRYGAGVGVLDGHIYAVGGSSVQLLKSVEVYRDGVWSFVADMHISRFRPGVAALDGLLYVFGGEIITYIGTVEIYNPKTNTWILETNKANLVGGVVVNRPPNFIN